MADEYWPCDITTSGARWLGVTTYINVSMFSISGIKNNTSHVTKYKVKSHILAWNVVSHKQIHRNSMLILNPASDKQRPDKPEQCPFLAQNNLCERPHILPKIVSWHHSHQSQPNIKNGYRHFTIALPQSSYISIHLGATWAISYQKTHSLSWCIAWSELVSSCSSLQLILYPYKVMSASEDKPSTLCPFHIYCSKFDLMPACWVAYFLQKKKVQWTPHIMRDI